MQTSNETTNLYKAIIEAAPEVQAIGKSKQAYGYKYATLDSLIDMLRQVLPKHGVWFAQFPGRIGEKSILTTRIFHVSGEWMEDSIEMTDTELQGKANDTQKVGASITYFRRYALSSIFGVAADEDVDGNLASKGPMQQMQKPQSKPAQPAPKSKLDPLNYLNQDLAERMAAGEDKKAIIKDYADILKTDDQKLPSEMTPDDCKYVATAIFKRKGK